jgi:hypothetical protein
MNKKKVKELSLDVLTNIKEAISRTDDVLLSLTLANIASKIALIGVEVNKSDWVSVEDGLPPVDKEVVVLTIVGRISFGHIVDKKIAKDYNGWNIPDVEYWLPFVDPKDK